jgi:toluene monooxygenase system protein E
MKTYSRLQDGRRRLSEYELVSTDVLYNYPSRFELRDSNQVFQWHKRYREGSALSVCDWTVFADPRATTYRSYTALQQEKEQTVAGLFDEIEETQYDQRLPEPWVRFLHNVYFPLRFPLHGCEMMAAYIGQMAPSSRLVNCAAFQAADEMRRIQHISYRTAQLSQHHSLVDPAEHRGVWEEAPYFQPLRELIERALVRYDWAEALVINNTVIKPRLDRWIDDELARVIAPANGDHLLGSVHFSLAQDSQWHRDWAAEALRIAVADTPENAEIVRDWTTAWVPLADAAVASLALAAAEADGIGWRDQSSW